jgi:hypothetical protein
MSQNVAMATIDFQGFSGSDGSSTRHETRHGSGLRAAIVVGNGLASQGWGPRRRRRRIADGRSTRPRSIIVARRVRVFLAGRPSTLALMGIDPPVLTGMSNLRAAPERSKLGTDKPLWPSHKSLTIWDGRPGSLLIVAPFTQSAPLLLWRCRWR